MNPVLAALFCSSLLFRQDDPSKLARELVEKLASDKIEERDEAARKLRDLGNAALEVLEKAAKSEDVELAARARRLLHTIPIAAILTPNLLARMPGIENRLADGDAHTWSTVFLEAALHHETAKNTPAIRKADLEVLAERALRGAATPEEGVEICESMESLALTSGSSELMNLLKHHDYHIRGAACRALVQQNAKEAVPHIIKLLEDPEDPVRCKAASALGEMGVKAAIPSIVKLLHDPELSVHGNAALALGELGATEAVPAISMLIREKDPFSRWCAAWALGVLGARDFITAITALLEDRDRTVRYFALQTLGCLGARDQAGDMAKLLDDPEEFVRTGAIEALGHLHVRESVPRLWTILERGTTSERSACIRTLVELEASSAVPAIQKRLADPTPDVRKAAASSLCMLGDSGGVTVLLQEPGSHICLNALRQPKAWQRLQDKILPETIRGTTRQVLERVTQLAGITVEWPPESSADGFSFWIGTRWAMAKPKSLLETITTLFSSCGFEVVLEADHMRVLPPKEAVAFWKEWWKNQERK